MIFSLLASLLASLYAGLMAMTYRKFLGIRAGEVRRYLKKCINLGLCYGGFVRPGSLSGSLGAGRAAFLCCVYDIASDWRDFDNAFERKFLLALDRHAPPRAVKLAWRLYRKERSGRLSRDGLERGVSALRFVLILTESEDYFPLFKIKRLGRLLQIVDDVLDLEEDVTRSELNCLVSSRRDRYLQELLDAASSLDKIFAKSYFMRAVLRFTSRKAAYLRGKGNGRAVLGQSFLLMD